MLERLDHRAGVEPQDLGQVGAVHTPQLARRSRLLLEVEEHVPGPIDLDPGDQILAQARDPIDQVVPQLDGVESARIHSPILVAGTAVKVVDTRRCHDSLVEIRAAAIVSDIIEAYIQLRNPEDLGPCELRFGHPHAGLGGGHHQRPGVGESQGGGEVDWKA